MCELALNARCAAMQGLTLLTMNPVLANGLSGLAASATAQAAVEVCF